MNETISRKYIVALVVTSVVILVGGALLKPANPQAKASSPSESASLQRLVRRQDLMNMAAFFAERSASMAPYVVYVEERNSSGLYWESPGNAVVTASAGPDSLAPPLATVQLQAQPNQPSRYAASPESAGGRWILLVGRAPDQQLVWSAALDGGTRPASCAGAEYREVVLSGGLNRSLAGFAAFDLDGALAGIVMACEESYHLVSTASITPLLKSFQAPERTIAFRYGFRAEPLDEDLRPFFRDESGLLLAEVRKGGLGYKSGLRAADLVVSVNGKPVPSIVELWQELQSSEPGHETAVVLMRGSKRLAIGLHDSAVTTTDASHPFGIDFATASSAVLLIEPESEGYRMGLRSGDRVVQIGNITNPTSAQLRQRLMKPGQTPLVLVYERGSRQIATLVSK